MPNIRFSAEAVFFDCFRCGPLDWELSIVRIVHSAHRPAIRRIVLVPSESYAEQTTTSIISSLHYITTTATAQYSMYTTDNAHSDKLRHRNRHGVRQIMKSRRREEKRRA